MKLVVSLLFFIFISGVLFAQKKEDVKTADTNATQSKKKTRIEKFKDVNDKVFNIMTKIPAPIISYSTETNWLFGLAKFNAFNLNKNDTISKASSIGGTIGASLSGQVFLHLGSELHWEEDKNILNISFGLERFPRAFWGVGGDINPDTFVLVTKSFLQIDITYKRKLYKNISIGPSYHFLNIYDVSYKVDSLAKPETYTGYNGGLNSGFGITTAYDSRDNIYNSTKGFYADFSTEFYAPIFGSKFVFNRYSLDLRSFQQVGSFVFAYQFYTQSNYGNTPVYSLALMGGTERMRGYFEGQYRNNTIVDTQFEIRRHLFWKFGAVAFISIGQVAPNYKSLEYHYYKYSFGGGLRLMVDEVHRTNLRFDFGFGKNTSALFFGFSEAF